MNTKTWQEMHPDKVIVGVVNFKDMVLVATQWQLFYIKDGKLEPVLFEVKEDEK
jgi:hypothetical protein